MSIRARVARVPVAVAAALTLYAVSAAQLPAAWAHVHASSDNALRGAMAIVTFQVPNESNTGALTTALSVALPDVAAASTETAPGWTARLDRDAASGAVRSVTWTAAPGGGIGADQFALFRVSMKLPDTDTVSFPATQTYSDGTVVKWDQPPLPGGGEPEHPAPTLTLAVGPAASHGHHPPSVAPADQVSGPPPKPADNTARMLGGGALVVAALGVCLGLIRRRA
ncbi:MULTISPECIES: YcnI family protein [unclassified Mycobacterium]|uniref:YcnI family protein n=1 Tax=unclassified Mycobacterium TaxID=2642494 RepID=UPI0007FFDA86|nr:MULTISPECIES: YcnI family protein [unclassified Mycobacterium]OBG66028.1 nuclear export factor GLE1 [Mycobacterium sp. E188]OBH35212.1 nuclear export factor GLE1 [Mycobacterium sp. E183]